MTTGRHAASRDRRPLINAGILVVLALAAATVAYQRFGPKGDAGARRVQSRGPLAAPPTRGRVRVTTSSAAPANRGLIPAATSTPPTPVGSGPGSGSPASITLAFAGDLLPHLPLDAAAAQFGRRTGVAFDFLPMLAPLEPILHSVDLPICHLEVPVAPTPAQISGYPVFGAPAELVAAAARAGYKGCDTVSNHALDKGQAGIKATLDTFDLLGLGHAGSARTQAESMTPMIYDVRGVKVAHLAYAYGYNGFTPPAAAPWSVNQIDEGKILADARAARVAGAQLVVVSLHWGTEGQSALNAQQADLGPRLAASPDIDLIVGHHAHVVQPIRRIDGKFVVFGLGNQLSYQHKDAERDGLLVIATATRGPDGRYSVTGLKAVPTWMDTPSWQVLPIAATLTGQSAAPALAALLRASYARTIAAISESHILPGLSADPLPAP